MTASLNLYDAAALRRLETRACAALGGDESELMRRAGQAAWRHLLQHWPQAQRIVVVCGPGNNGGDGYVLAGHAQESGRDVVVVRVAAPRTDAARRACASYAASRGRIVDVHAGPLQSGLPACDLVVDALFGIGLSRAPDAGAAALIAAIDACDAPVFALDVPSGIDADTGHPPGPAVRAARTLQFIAAHAGLYTGDALDFAGALDTAPLDVPEGAWTDSSPMAELLTPAMLHAFLPPRPRNTHKGRHGHVLCIGGDTGMGGAIMLCAEAALRCGAGLVSVATQPMHVAPVLSRLPECMAVGIESAAQLEPLLLRADALALGPGLGRGTWGRALLDAALASGKPLVVDADALALLADTECCPRDAVLTPHPGEAARMLDTATAAVQADRFGAADNLARATGCAVVLKGAGSIVAAPDRIAQVIAAGNPGMAVGGMGDVLTGVIAALLAQGMAPFDAARCGALLHAHAGDLAARGGERGLLPSDLLACLRQAANPSSAA
jgi:NAD(P)H-hydrate epimerase